MHSNGVGRMALFGIWSGVFVVCVFVFHNLSVGCSSVCGLFVLCVGGHMCVICAVSVVGFGSALSPQWV